MQMQEGQHYLFENLYVGMVIHREKYCQYYTQMEDFLMDRMIGPYQDYHKTVFLNIWSFATLTCVQKYVETLKLQGQVCPFWWLSM